MKTTLDQLLRDLVQYGFMPATDLSGYLDTFPPEKRPREAETLAGELVRDEKLTRFQATMLLDGKGDRLLLGDYLLSDKIGEGGMGQVVKAVHRARGQVAAVKVLRVEWLESRTAVQRFHQEVEVATRLKHENIVATYDAGVQDGTHYLAMEYVEGCDLAAMLDRGGALPVSVAVGYVLQAAKGLEYAHSHGVIHRDIKPANLLLDRNGTIKILDMGLARIDEPEEAGVGATLAERLTRTGQMLGTVDYVSPEQAADTRSADHRSDIYSLGCTLYRLLTGKPVYGGESAVQKLMAHCEAEIPSLADSLPEIPAKLCDVFVRMVAKKPEDRYQSMAEVIGDLQECLEPGQTVVRREPGADRGEPAGPSVGGAAGQYEVTGVWAGAGEPSSDKGPSEPTLSPGAESTIQLPGAPTVSMDKSPAAKRDPQALGRLKVIEGPGVGQVVELHEPKSVLGRHPDCQVPIDSMEASRHHAQILLVDGEWFLEDLHSRNGTLLNSQPIRGRQKMCAGDRIFIGDMTFTFHPG